MPNNQRSASSSKLAVGHFWPVDVGVWLMQYFPLSCLEVMLVVVCAGQMLMLISVWFLLGGGEGVGWSTLCCVGGWILVCNLSSSVLGFQLCAIG
jgi:hypothetical protein